MILINTSGPFPGGGGDSNPPKWMFALVSAFIAICVGVLCMIIYMVITHPPSKRTRHREAPSVIHQPTQETDDSSNGILCL